MPYDLLIKNGTVIDGSGLPRYRADVGVKNGKIAAIGRIRESAPEVIDAEDTLSPPGSSTVTRMDAQVFWDPLGVVLLPRHAVKVMGNCGFTLAPCAEKDKHLVVRNLQRAGHPAGRDGGGNHGRGRAIPVFLDAVDALPKGINYSGYVGHSAIRTFVMGERAFDGPASEEDLRAMGLVRQSIRAGAIGFTSSRSPSHETPEGRLVASRNATWEEVRRLVNAMGELNAGLFEIAGEGVDRNRRPRRARLAYAAARPRGRVGRPMPFGVSDARARQAPGRSISISWTRPPRWADACCCRPIAGRSRRAARSRRRCLSTACRSGRTSASSRSRSRRRGCAIPSCVRSSCRPPARATIAGRSAPRRVRPTTTSSMCSTPSKVRTAPWRTSRASAASIRRKR